MKPLDRVLIVDDEAQVLALLQRALAQPGRLVEIAANADTALQMLGCSSYDLVLTDLRMPGALDGEDLMKLIKDEYPASDVIVVSAQPSLSSSLTAIRSNVWDYLLKPVDLGVLRPAVDRCLAHRRSLRRLPRGGRARRQVSKLARDLSRAEGSVDLLRRYVPRDVLDSALAPAAPRRVPAEREATMLFADVRHFTDLAADAPPALVMRWLNELFAVMAPIVHAHGGMIDKFIGDGMLAVFGATREMPDQAAAAVRCAKELLAAIENFNARRRRRALPPLEVGIGVNCGAVLAGDIGTPERSDFSVIGAAVNLAARLEKRALPGEVLVGPAVAARVSMQFRLRTLGSVRLKGFPEGVSVFRVDDALLQEARDGA